MSRRLPRTGSLPLLGAVVTFLALLPAGGCRSSRSALQKLSSPYALDRAEAAVRLAEKGDTQAIHKLVNLLEEDDPALRMYGMLALRRLTDQTYGYQYYDELAQRQAAVARWRAALQSGSVGVKPPPAGS